MRNRSKTAPASAPRTAERRGGRSGGPPGGIERRSGGGTPPGGIERRGSGGASAGGARRRKYGRRASDRALRGSGRALSFFVLLLAIGAGVGAALGLWTYWDMALAYLPSPASTAFSAAEPGRLLATVSFGLSAFVFLGAPLSLFASLRRLRRTGGYELNAIERRTMGRAFAHGAYALAGFVSIATAIGFAAMRAAEKQPTAHDIGAILWMPALATAGIWLWVLLMRLVAAPLIAARVDALLAARRAEDQAAAAEATHRAEVVLPEGLEEVPDLVAELSVRFDALLERQHQGAAIEDRLHQLEQALARIESVVREPRQVIVRETVPAVAGGASVTGPVDELARDLRALLQQFDEEESRARS